MKGFSQLTPHKEDNDKVQLTLKDAQIIRKDLLLLDSFKRENVIFKHEIKRIANLNLKLKDENTALWIGGGSIIGILLGLLIFTK